MFGRWERFTKWEVNDNCDGEDVNDSECEDGWFDKKSITIENSIDRFIVFE